MAELRAQKGLGGGLILVGLIIIISLFRQAGILSLQYLPMLFDGSWESLTHPRQPHYHPLWKPILIGEMIANTLFLCLWAYVAYLFVARSRLLPHSLQVALIASIGFIIIEAFALKTALSTARAFTAGTLHELVAYVALAAFFIPYAFYSRRVKETFVN
jgi:hypothetical protein